MERRRWPSRASAPEPVGSLTYEQEVEAFRVTDRLSGGDRAKLMGETLSAIYNWPKAQI
jgi:hypothetical protein